MGDQGRSTSAPASWHERDESSPGGQVREIALQLRAPTVRRGRRRELRSPPPTRPPMANPLSDVLPAAYRDRKERGFPGARACDHPERRRDGAPAHRRSARDRGAPPGRSTHRRGSRGGGVLLRPRHRGHSPRRRDARTKAYDLRRCRGQRARVQGGVLRQWQPARD